ncbi:hypothetical protein AA313_de0207748 [Arthrobotrys entomopaga]|nr:hypothetical protein AA313_de0207748 [Arthrobotrys entomopaga]
MDIQPLPKYPLHPPLEVILSNTEPYDGGDFDTYPQRQGWTERTVGEWEELFKNPPLEFATFLERWLLFGALHIAFGDLAPASKFMRKLDNPPRVVLTTEHLRYLIPYANGSASALSAINRALLLHLALSRGTLGNLYEVLHRRDSLARYMINRSTRDPRSPEVAMATAVVHEMLVQAVFQRSLKLALSSNLGVVPPMSHRRRSLAWILLRKEGWCPADLMSIFNRLNTSCFYFLYHLPRPVPERTHPLIRIREKGEPDDNTNNNNKSKSVTLCTEFKCGQTILTDATYERKHAEGCTGCEDMIANQTKLCEILSKGKVPLILSIDESEESNEIYLVESEPDVEYVAISHVWSDGLGNVELNAIPRCQMLRLSRMVRDVGGEDSDFVLFWLDTVCVPPDSANLKDAQDMAIGLMRQTYEEAAAVLVLDSWLFGTSSLGKSDAELLLQIFCSSWTKRLWTYQEGALAKLLYFQFSDNYYNVDEAMERLLETADDIMNCTLLPSLLELHHQIRRFKSLEFTIAHQLPAIAAALNDRRTSVPSDEALCLGTLLNLDTLELAKADPETRMAKFWRMLPKVPETVLFEGGETFDTDGLRWAPKTFLQPKSDHRGIKDNTLHHSTKMRLVTDLADNTPRGLKFACAGIQIRCGAPTKLRGHAFFRAEADDQWYHVKLHYNVSKYGRMYPGEIPVHGEIAILLWILTPSKNIPWPNKNGWNDDFGQRENATSRALVVEVLEEKDRVVYCRKLCGGFWERLEDVRDQQQVEDLNGIFSQAVVYGDPVCWHQKYRSLVAGVGKKRTSSQVWCVM